MSIFTFVTTHMDKVYPPRQWEKLMGIRVLDPDGWRDRRENYEWQTPLTLQQFVDRLNNSTIDVRVR